METKLTALRAHTSQVLKNGLVDLEALEALARYRGFQARIRHAEAFAAARFLWQIDDVGANAATADAAGVAAMDNEGVLL